MTSEPRELSDDTTIWHYLKIAFDIEDAADKALLEFRDGKTLREAGDAATGRYRINHRRFIRADGETRDFDGHDPSFGEVIMAMALAKLATNSRSEFEVDFAPLRYPSNVYSPSERERIEESLLKRLSDWNP